MNKIFVYGTLKKHHSNFDVIRTGIFCGEGKLNKSYGFRMISMGAFPALIPCDVSIAKDIKGEIWKVDKNIFTNVDYLEGHPNFYFRVKYNIIDSDENKHTCWTYYIPEPTALTVVSAKSVDNGTWLGRDDSQYGSACG